MKTIISIELDGEKYVRREFLLFKTAVDAHEYMFFVIFKKYVSMLDYENHYCGLNI